MKKERQFTARLNYFEVVVTSTIRDDGTEVHRVTAGFPFENAPKDYEPMEFVLGSASEVLDLLEVVDVSNGLIDTLQDIARLGEVYGLGTSDDAGRFRRVATSSRATSGVTLAGGAA